MKKTEKYADFYYTHLQEAIFSFKKYSSINCIKSLITSRLIGTPSINGQLDSKYLGREVDFRYSYNKVPYYRHISSPLHPHQFISLHYPLQLLICMESCPETFASHLKEERKELVRIQNTSFHSLRDLDEEL